MYPSLASDAMTCVYRMEINLTRKYFSVGLTGTPNNIQAGVQNWRHAAHLAYKSMRISRWLDELNAVGQSARPDVCSIGHQCPRPYMSWMILSEGHWSKMHLGCLKRSGYDDHGFWTDSWQNCSRTRCKTTFELAGTSNVFLRMTYCPRAAMTRGLVGSKNA